MYAFLLWLELHDAKTGIDRHYSDVIVSAKASQIIGVSNHRRLGCLLSGLFKRRWKEAPKLRVTGLCEGNPPVTGGFPSERVSNAANVFVRWRYHVLANYVYNTLRATEEGIYNHQIDNSQFVSVIFCWRCTRHKVYIFGTCNVFFYQLIESEWRIYASVN